MEAKEIREGYWYLFEGKPQQVDAHDMLNIYNSGQNHLYQPIPLTPEWLANAGFDAKGFLETGSEQAILIEGNTFYLFGPDSATSGQCFSNSIQYVHQLQNLYHALTGTELTFNLQANG